MKMVESWTMAIEKMGYDGNSRFRFSTTLGIQIHYCTFLGEVSNALQLTGGAAVP